MATSKKPVRTGSKHPLPFAALGPGEFERLCLWLAAEEKFERLANLGEAGSEGGRDVVGWKDGRCWVFQCKRVRAFSLSHAKKEIAKLRALPVEQQPDELVFVVSRAVGAKTRVAIRSVWGDEATCHFWSGNELDRMVKRHPTLLAEFFGLPPDTSRVGRVISLPLGSLGDLFQGREEVLATLHQKLTEGKSGKATAIAGKAVHGLGGVGKTRLAIEYAWRYAEEYSAVLFVRVGKPGDLHRNLAALCAPSVLNLPEQDVTKEEIQVAAVLSRLAEQPGWLVILDNIDSKEAAAAVNELIPRLHGGHVLLTGRLARWGAGVEPIELDVLAEDDARSFLLARTETTRRKTGEDEAQALQLARELGFLPLALEQAGAYIAERKLTLAGYLEEWRSRHEHVLTWFDPQVSHYPASVAVTWQTSVDQLGASARRLLERLAWLGPEPIPESLLEVPVPGLSEEEIDPDPPATLAELATYSLVTRANDAPTFIVHRLVQDVTRCSLRGDLKTIRLAEALSWVNGAFIGDGDDVRAWPLLRPLSPHAQAVVFFADGAGITNPTARLTNELAVFLQAANRLAEAEPLMRRTLVIVEESLGGEDPEVAARLNNLAWLLKSTNRLGDAEPLMRRALAIAEASLGANHPEVATYLNNLAQLLKAKNSLGEAETLMRRVVAILECSSGGAHPNLAGVLNNLAQLLQSTNRLGEAEPLMARVVKIFESSLGENHPNVAIALNNLAQLFQDTNRLGEAEPLMRRSLAIDEASFGADHPNVARDLNNLALLLQATDRLGEAEPLMRRHLVIFLDFTHRTGHEHPHLRTAFDNYRALLEEMGKSDAEIEASISELEAGWH